MRLSNVCFHAGPIIRQQNAFAIMDWTFRVKIFRRMLAFANKLDFQLLTIFRNYASHPQFGLLLFTLPTREI